MCDTCVNVSVCLCDTYGTVWVNVSGEKALCVIPMVQSVCFRGKGIVCDTYVNVSGEKALCVIPMVQSVCFRGKGIVCDTH